MQTIDPPHEGVASNATTNVKFDSCPSEALHHCKVSLQMDTKGVC